MNGQALIHKSKLTAIKLEDKLPLSLEPKCSITCQLLFLVISPPATPTLPDVPPPPENGLVVAVEVGVERGVVVSVTGKHTSTEILFKSI